VVGSKLEVKMSVAAVIFDLDGTVIADEDEYGRAFAKVLRRLGVGVNSKFPHQGGIGVKENWPLLLKKYKIKTDKSIEELTRETQDAYLATLSRVEVKPGFEDLVEKLKDKGILTALATSNTWFMAETILQRLNLERYFDCLTTGEEVAFKKPDPDIFLITAGKLGVEREDCVVVEDSYAGIQAAHGANMKVIGVFRSEKHARELRGADLLVKDFTELTVDDINSL
jgi:HAD superfamily hydrolase (TIGR01509 family)